MVVALIVGLAMGGIVGVYRLKRRHDFSLSLLRYHGAAERLYVQYERSWRDSLQQTERMLNVLEDGARRAGDDDALELKLFRRAAERERRYADGASAGTRLPCGDGPQIPPCRPLPLAPGRARSAQAGMNSFGPSGEP